MAGWPAAFGYDGIGGLRPGYSFNCYVEPVYTVDADLVMVLNEIPRLSELLAESSSELRIQFTTDPRYQDFPSRAQRRKVLETEVFVACLEDVTQGKLWAYGDPARRLGKRKKDELDLIRLAESFPELKRTYPPQLVSMLDASK